MAQRLAARGFRVVAFDWRGHGESEWLGAGSYYHFPDYVRDLAGLLPQYLVEGEERVHLVGHSMGGTAAALYAGASGAHIKTLTLLEGWGIAGRSPRAAPALLGNWLAAASSTTKAGRPMRSTEDAARRMQSVHPRLTRELAHFLAEKGSKRVGDLVEWRFDPRHRLPSPMPFWAEAFEACLEKVAVPTLTIASKDGLQVPEADSRLDHLQHRQHHEVADWGHMMHWYAAEPLSAVLSEFLSQH